MIDIVDINLKIIIAFSLVMIMVLLAYIAFFKESVKKSRPSSRHH